MSDPKVAWFPTPIRAIIYVEDEPEVGPALDRNTARLDDAFWATQVRLPYTPQRFLNWWIARRWVRPRDIRKE